MSIFVAFLIAFGVLNPNLKSTQTMSASTAQQIIVNNNLQQQFIIWGQEGDDF